MPLPERALPARMQRVAVVAPESGLRDVLVALAGLGCVELSGRLGPAEGDAVDAVRRIERGRRGNDHPLPALARDAVAVDELERRGAVDLLAGEIELRRRMATAVRHRGMAVLPGWTPRRRVSEVAVALGTHGAAIVELPEPPGVEPPSLLVPGPPARPFGPLVELYAPVPYRDLDPTPFAAAAYFLMFGMMFGDVGDGLLVVVAALALRAGLGGRRLAAVRRAWPFALAAGLAGTAFGLLYGECFGPTGIVPALWMDPLDNATLLLAIAVGIGVVLLVTSAAIGTVNRWREAGPAAALLAPSGAVGLALLVGATVAVGGRVTGAAAVMLAGAAVTLAAVGGVVAGAVVEAPAGSGRGAQVVVASAESLLRVFSNVFSFTRLGAFGLMHAAVGRLVYEGAASLWGGPAAIAAAVVLFVLGSALALALEGLVIAIQALRLEYYELFSRIFAREGRPFVPWRIRVTSLEESRC
jgi:V/A-type H+-transporting ATPase subunit I